MATNQNVSPRETFRRMKELGVPSNVLAEFSDLSPTQISLWKSGDRGLSLDAQIAVLRALTFFEELAAEAREADLSFNFADTPGLQKRWVRFLRARDEAELVRTRGELQGSCDAVSTK